MTDPNATYDPSKHYGLPQKVAQEAFHSFASFDVNRNGSITSDEIKQCLRKHSIQFNEADVDDMLKKYIDINEDGKITLDEYMKFMAAVYRHEYEGFNLHVDYLKQ